LDDQEPRTEHVFLVRMWTERAGDLQWRGSVQHVASGRRLFVGSATEVGDFIALQLRTNPNSTERIRDT